jgi:hypothetical protein
VLEEIEDAADIRVRDSAGQLDFAAEALICSLIHRDFGSNGLQRDAIAERQILGFVELPHAAAGNEAHDAEPVAEQITRPERGDGVRGARGVGVKRVERGGSPTGFHVATI